MDIEIQSPLRENKRDLWRMFLTNAGLNPDDSVEQTVLVWDGDSLVATGSRQGDLLKCIAVDPMHQGEGLLATVLTALRQEAFREGYSHLFLYTKPANAHLFTPLFFYPVAKTGDVLLMENQQYGIDDFLSSLPKAPGKNIGSAVMNCDPFTLGHRYLIETAAAQCDHLFVFVLTENRGGFPASDRMKMVQSGTADIANVTVLPTGPYLISNATFPTYFLKNRDQATQLHCQLDVEIFVRHFVPYFGITQRFVGTEPLSAMTNQYNQVLKEALPERGVAVTEIPRLEIGGTPISASAVRAAWEQKDWAALQNLVPKTTLDHLKSLT